MPKTKSQNSQLYGTCDAARLVGCAESTLARYEVRGIVHPQRTQSGRRIFTPTDIAAAKKFRHK